MHEISLTLEEVDSLVSDQVTSKVLSGVDAANDGSTVSISALEELNEAGLFDGLLEINGTSHHGNSLLSVVDVGRTSETSNSIRSLLETTLSDEPPGRLGGEEDEDGEGSGEHPLKSDRHTGFLLAD